MLLPLNLLAAQTMADLAYRQIPIRVLNVLAPATAVCVVWWVSGNLREAVAELARGHASPETGLGLHLAIDLIIAAILFTRGLERWARRARRPPETGSRWFSRHGRSGHNDCRRLNQGRAHIQPQTRDYLGLRDVILRRHDTKPFQEIDIIGPDRRPFLIHDSPATDGRLRFILRTTLPQLVPRNLATTDELLAPCRHLMVPESSSWSEQSNGSPLPLFNPGSVSKRSFPEPPASMPSQRPTRRRDVREPSSKELLSGRHEKRRRNILQTITTYDVFQVWFLDLGQKRPEPRARLWFSAS